MKKHQANHYWRHTRHFRWQYLLAAAGIAAVVCLLALRNNSQQMAIRRDAVFAADKAGGDTRKALGELQAYVTTHMNTELTSDNGVYPPIQLQYTYQRLMQQQAAGNTTSNGDLYNRAQAYCQAQNQSDFSGRNRVPCIERYVAQNGQSMQMNQNKVDDSLYKFDFASPRWSPDLAGWSMIVAGLLGALAVVQFFANRWFRKHR